uniref:EH domain-containing protein n=1 Tax=Sinocyclocheilus rhinocerous TaxID=307959 RepID=A0A673MGJ0_9TELE
MLSVNFPTRQIPGRADTEDWIVSRDKHRYDEIFYTLMPINGKVTGINAKREMMNSRLPNTVLGKIWKLADCDKDGMLDDEEFALAQHLIKIKLEGFELPIELPNHLVPPSHRKDPTTRIVIWLNVTIKLQKALISLNKHEKPLYFCLFESASCWQKMNLHFQ